MALTSLMPKTSPRVCGTNTRSPIVINRGPHTSNRLRANISSRRNLGRHCLHALPQLSEAVALTLPLGALAEAAAVTTDVEPSGTLAYIAVALGISVFSFTFFVLPQFKEALKEPVMWLEMFEFLVQDGSVKPVKPSEAYAKANKRGAVLVDVRLQDKYNKSHAEGSLSVPLYRPIEKWDLPSTLRRIGFSFFGVFATELNPDFLDLAASSIPRGKEIVVICEMGGSLKNKIGVERGFQSRSLKAAYTLLQAGYKKVSYCEDGLPQWRRDGLPLECVEE